MTKFSAKKPITVFVCVLVAILLGTVSFTHMTPDLLPNMDFPYVVVITADPGATPEEVEDEISRPLEKTLSTLENLKSIQSTSAGNASTVMLEFENGVNMDGTMVDILSKISAVENGTPYILRINPSMIPVMVAAVNCEGMSADALSQLMTDTLENQLEGINGVASVDAAGVIKNSVEIHISEEKIARMNQLLAEAVNRNLAEAGEGLTQAQAGIDSGKTALDASKKALEQQQAETLGQLSETSMTLNQVVAMQTAYEAQLSGLQASAAALGAERAACLDGKQKLVQGVAELNTALNQVGGTRTMLAPLKGSALPDSTALTAILSDPAMLAALQAQGCHTLGEAKALDTKLASQEVQLEAQKQTLEGQLPALEARVTEIDAALNNLRTETAAARAICDQLKAAAEQAKTGSAQVDVGKLQAAAGFGSAAAGMEAAAGKLQSAQEDLDAARTTYEEQCQAALKQANLTDAVTMKSISGVLTAQNFDMPAGYVYRDGQSYIVSVGDGVASLEELRDLVLFDLGIDGVEPITLSQVAQVETTDNSDSVYASLNGSPAVLMTFMKQSSYATATVSDEIHKEFEALSQQYPGMTFTPLMDQGDYIHTLTGSIIQSLLLGALFAVVVLFLFLRDIRPTFITLLSIPISLMVAITLMYFTGVSINIMSLAGLAIAVGMLVDNSVVVIENTYRLRALGVSAVKAAVSGAAQVAGAITASTLTTICVFLPILFISGVTKQLFTDLALTLTFSLVASLIVALTLVPAASSVMLNRIRPPKSGLMDRLKLRYRKALLWSVGHKAAVLLAALALLAGSAGVVLSRGFTFLTGTESPQLSVSITMPEGADFAATAADADAVLQRILAQEGVETAGALIEEGQSSGMLLGGGNGDVSLYVKLKSAYLSQVTEISQAIQEDCADLDCTVEVSNASMMNNYSQVLAGSGISVYLYGQDLKDLQTAAEQMAGALADVPGVQEADSGLGETAAELHFTVDKDAAAKEGLTVAQVYQQVAEALTLESGAFTLNQDGVSYDVKVSNRKDTLTQSFVEALTLKVTDRSGKTHTVPLSQVAQVEETRTLAAIQRTGQRRYVNVTASVETGNNVTHVTEAAKKAVSALQLPQGVTYTFKGENETILQTMQDLLTMLLLGVLLVYLVMVAQFQSLKSPFIVMFTIPLAFTGGFLALLVCGMELGLMSMLGMVTLTGIIVNNGIVLVDCINGLRQAGKARVDAIAEACSMRLRPILMTSITTILGLSVIALGLDESSAMMQPLAVTCIGGLTYATLMTLFVVPVIYDAMSKKELRTVSEADLEISDQ